MRISAGAGDKVKAMFSQTAYLTLFLGLGMDTAFLAAIRRSSKPNAAKIGIKDFYNTFCDPF